jgi:hypothetical protein
VGTSGLFMGPHVAGKTGRIKGRNGLEIGGGHRVSTDNHIAATVRSPLRMRGSVRVPSNRNAIAWSSVPPYWYCFS